METGPLRNKITFIDSFTDYVELLCLTETHLDPSVSELRIDDFPKLLRKDRNMFGVGVLIYAKENITISRILAFESNQDEIMWTKLQCENDIYIYVIYRPQWHTNRSGIWDRFHPSLEQAFDITTNIIITGDINYMYDMLQIINNPFFDILSFSNLKNIISLPTRITETSSKLLDPVIVSDSIQIFFSDVIHVDNDISDHCATMVMFNVLKCQQKSYKRKVCVL